MTIQEPEIAFLTTIFWETQCKFFQCKCLMQRFVDCPDSWNCEWLHFRNWEISLVNKRNGELALPYAHSVDTTGVYVSWILNCHFPISYCFSSSVYLWGDWFQKIRKSFLVDAKYIDTALKERPKLDVWNLLFKKKKLFFFLKPFPAYHFETTFC